MSLSANVNEKANLIWAIADKLTGVYKPHEYGKVILPLTVIRRFDCILSDTKEAVLEKHNSLAEDIPLRDSLLKRASGYEFYNTSKYTFNTLLNDPNNIEANFKNYLNGFSENVRQIIEKFKFNLEIDTLAEKNLLFIVISTRKYLRYFPAYQFLLYYLRTTKILPFRQRKPSLFCRRI